MNRQPPRSPGGSRLFAHLECFRALWAGELDAALPQLADGGTAAHFAGMVVGQQVAVPLARRLGEAVARLPPKVGRRLRRRQALQSERTARLVALHDRIRDGFAARDLPAVLLKGPPLARRLYGALDARESVDLDLLIRPDDGRRARATLAELGFARRSRALFGVPLTTRFVHALDFVAADGPVDLHWALARHVSLRLDPSRPWRTARSENLGAGTVCVTGEEVEIVSLALGVVRDGERGRLKLKHLLDLSLALALPGAAERALEAAREERAERPLARAGAVAAAAFGPVGSAGRDWAAAIDRHGGVEAAASALPALLAGTAGAHARRWAFASWHASFTACAAWWLVSLPFRLAVHGRKRGPRSVRLVSSGAAAPHRTRIEKTRPTP